jgi:hypothetical protein
MKKKPIGVNIKVRHSNQSINMADSNSGNNGTHSDNGEIGPESELSTQSNSNTEKPTGENELEKLRELFFNQIRDTPSSFVHKFMETRLRITDEWETVDQACEVMAGLLKTVSSLKFAISELIDFVGSQMPNTVGKPDENSGEEGSGSGSGSSPDSDKYPDSFEDFSGDPLGENGLEGFVRLSAKKMIDLLNDILSRLKRLEEIAELQREKNKLVESQIEINSGRIKIVAEKVDMLSNDIDKKITDEVRKIHVEVMTAGMSVEIKEAGEIRKVKGVFPRQWKDMVELGSARMNILLVGPTGCGKSYLAERLAEALNLRYSSISCCEGMSESEFKGWLLPMGENGQWEYVPSDFVDSYEKGGLYNADEFDACDSNVGTWVNKALAGRSFHLPTRKGNTLVKKSDKFVWVACSNTYGTGANLLYSGRNQLDGATIDRHLIGTIELDYDAIVEKAIVNSDILLWGQQMRKVLKELQIETKPVSTRFLLDASIMNKMYSWDIEKVESVFFRSWEPDNIKRCKSVMRDVITRQLSAVEAAITGRSREWA